MGAVSALSVLDKSQGVTATVENGQRVFHLPAKTFELRSPLELGALARGGVVLRGDVNGKTRIHGSRSYRARRVGPDEALPNGMRRDKSLFVIEADSLIRKLWIDGGERKPGCLAGSLVAVYQGDRRLTCASWPKSGYARAAVLRSDDPARLVFDVPPEKAADWAGAGLSVSGYFGFDWLHEAADVKTLNATLGQLALAPLRQAFKPMPGLRYAVHGAPADLTEPGEYVSDPTTGRIFIRPLDDAEAPEFQIPVARSLISIVGGGRVVLENIHFAYSIGNGLDLRDVEGAVIRDGSVMHVGDTGIRVRGGHAVVVERMRVFDIGGTGIDLAGGDRQTLAPGGHAVRQSVITNTSVRKRTYRPAVRLDGVGNSVEDTFIADLPHNAITFAGNDHRIAFNEITRVVQETSDAGAIYAGRDWTFRGNVIEGNYLHDIVPLEEPSLLATPDEPKAMEVRGIYLDDLLSGTSVLHNILINVCQPIIVGGGRDNRIEGNLLARPPRTSACPAGAITFHSWGLAEKHLYPLDPNSTLRKGLAAVPYNRPPYSDRYPGLTDILNGHPGEPINNGFSGNVAIGGPLFHFKGVAQTYARLGQNHEGLEDADLEREDLPAVNAWIDRTWPDDVSMDTRNALRNTTDRLSRNASVWTAIARR
ncbi:right-handed parallel beta-helix repeat-containing protein [Chthonobacter albigriseus]|uniref:right-handed parallel beta-helix repeat-containing protein n=1 Tax=Chthonobacter albigriseus TaxID=1683161 RepID=UPI0015EE6821|nr:right-handed parallel beta-helix repeat-containing protein [Chthonobacter albigriseus]